MNTAVRVHQERLARIRNATTRNVLHLFDQLPAYHSNDAEAFAAKAVPVVHAGQVLTARATSAYVAQRARIRPVAVDLTKVTGEAVRKGVKPHTAYQRPFGIIWGALADGVPLNEATTRGRDRLALMAATDIWLSMRATSTVVSEGQNLIWVRVADSGACDLCQASDGQPYDQADDMAGHPHCGCTIDPQPGDTSSSASDSSAVSVHESDEVGPVLYEAGHSFEGA